ncbi:hypothetical protein J6590_034314 [Homalodisca vitripennis]|nr:hypothetical protein J6590_034314 [Homalodisca vitripennis]
MAGCSRTLCYSGIDLVISSDCDDSSECSDVPELCEVVGGIEDVVRSDHSGRGSDGEPDNGCAKKRPGAQLSVCPLPGLPDRHSELIEVRSTVSTWKQWERERVNALDSHLSAISIWRPIHYL